MHLSRSRMLYSGLIPSNLMTLARISASSATSLVKHRERVHKGQRAEPSNSTRCGRRCVYHSGHPGAVGNCELPQRTTLSAFPNSAMKPSQLT